MYTEQSIAVVPVGTGVLAADVLTATGDHGEYVVLSPCSVRRIMAYVSTAVVGPTTAPVVTFRRRPTPGSATGQIDLGTLTVPTGTAVGKVVYKDVSPVKLDVGDSILITVSTAATGGTPAGGAYYGFELELSPDDPRNQPDMVQSA